MTAIALTRPGHARVSVVVPAMNEAQNIPHVFAGFPDGLHEVILVDGNSADDTVAVARRERPDVVVDVVDASNQNFPEQIAEVQRVLGDARILG